MTDHTTLKMHREHVRVSNREMISGFLEQECVANVGLHDEPYPYVVPMNYGYEWDEADNLIFWFHMAFEGHRLKLIAADPHVSVCVWSFLLRSGHKPYRGEFHDYRSVMAYGTAEVIYPDQDPDEFLHGFGVLCDHTNFAKPKRITDEINRRLRILKVSCPSELVIGKMQYDYTGPNDIAMPSIEDVDSGKVDPKKVPPYKG